jgi:tetratricopeptide (TPR) repeat protein
MSPAWDDDGDESGTPGFIICKACGTRIRADRDACLRCGTPLESAPETISLATISSGRPLIVTIAVAAVVLAIVALIWIYRPLPEDETSQPVTSTIARGAAGTPSAGATARGAAASAADSARGAVPLEGEAWEIDEFANSPDAPLDDSGTSDVADTRAQLEQTNRERPNDVGVLKDLARALVKSGDRAGAIARLEHATEVAPKDWTSHFLLGRLFADDRQWGSAATEFRQASLLAPSDPACEFNFAMALHRSGNDKGAVVEFQTAVRLAPTASKSHLALANALERTGDMTAAQAEYQQYLQLDPNGANAEAVRTHTATMVGGTGA